MPQISVKLKQTGPSTYVLYPTGTLTLNTEDVKVIDAGSTDASEQDWIEVTVGGTTGYIRVYAEK